VSANYFDALGIRPILGRGFDPKKAGGATHVSDKHVTWKWFRRPV